MGIINLYNTISAEHEVIKATGKLKDILPDVNFQNCYILKAGERVDENYIVEDGDILYLRLTPSEAISTVLLVVGIVAAVVGAGVAIGTSIYANHQAEETKRKMEKAQQDADNLASQINTLPFLRGAKNKSALGNPIQYLMGEMFNTPYLLTDGYYSIAGERGEKQYWNAILTCGYGPQLIKSISIGSQKIKTYTDTTPQTRSDNFDEDSIYYDDDNLIEIAQDYELNEKPFIKKVVSVQDGSEIKHDYGEDAQPVIKQLSKNTKEVELCIQFNGLRKYNTEASTWEERRVKITPSWSNNGGSTWNDFSFDFPTTKIINNKSTSTPDTYTADGKWTEILTKKEPISGSYGYTYQWVKYISNDPSMEIDEVVYKKTVNPSGEVTQMQPSAVTYKEISYTATNELSLNTNKTVRFSARKLFTWNDTHNSDGTDRDILIRVIKDTPKMESNSTEDCYLLYYNSFCYDAKKSSAENGLVDCKPIDSNFTGKTTRIGIRIVANESTQDTLDEINVISCSVARVWENNAWTEEKRPTRNPAAIILELLTSDVHKHSKYSDDEIDMPSFGALYRYCDDNEFYTDAIISQQIKKRDIITNILSTVFADLIINPEGKLEIVIDKKEDTPVALLNSQCIRNITYAKSFDRKPDGLKINFTNRDAWGIDTTYVMLENRERTADDILTELSIDYVTTSKHINKIAQRKLRTQTLQPTEIIVDIGREGDYYPLYSTVMLQMEQLKRGLQSTVIKAVDTIGNVVSKIYTADLLTFETGKRYALVIQSNTNLGRKFYKYEVTGTGTTNELEVIDAESEGIPLINSTASFGYFSEEKGYEPVTNIMKIVGISASDSNTIQLKLKDYNPAVYEYGPIPQYKSNLTPRPNRQSTSLSDVVRAELSAGIDEKIAEATSTYQPIRQLDSISSAEGYPEGTLGIYKNQFYRVESGVWRELDSNNYLGLLFAEPSDVGIGAYFVPRTSFSKLSALKVNNKALVVNGAYFGLYKQFYINEVYILTSDGWERITDKNDYRYVIAMNDIASNGGNLPYYVEQKISDITPKYLGVFDGTSRPIPENVNKGDWFAYTGESTTQFTKGEVYTWIGGWVIDTNNDHKIGALDDLFAVADSCGSEMFANVIAAKLSVNNAFINSLTANEAFINNLVVKTLMLKNGGYIKSETYETSGGTKGIYIDDEGNAMINDGRTTSYLGQVDDFHTGDVITDKYTSGIILLYDAELYGNLQYVGIFTPTYGHRYNSYAIIDLFNSAENLLSVVETSEAGSTKGKIVFNGSHSSARILKV